MGRKRPRVEVHPNGGVRGVANCRARAGSKHHLEAKRRAYLRFRTRARGLAEGLVQGRQGHHHHRRQCRADRRRGRRPPRIFTSKKATIRLLIRARGVSVAGQRTGRAGKGLGIVFRRHREGLLGSACLRQREQHHVEGSAGSEPHSQMVRRLGLDSSHDLLRGKPVDIKGQRCRSNCCRTTA